MPYKRTSRKSGRRSSKKGGRKRTYKRKSAYSKSRRTFIRKGRRNNVGTYYNGSEEIKLETPSLKDANYNKNISFELQSFPRLVDLHQNFKYVKIKKAQLRFVPCQTNNYWYNQQTTGNGCLRAVSWLNQDGDLSSLLVTFEDACNKPYSKTHTMVRGLMRNFTPKCIQQVQFDAPGATTIPITKNSNPWLLSDESLSVLRVGPGVWIPQVAANAGDAEIFYEVFMKVWYSCKGVDV